MSIKKFTQMVEGYTEKKIETTAHTFFRINQKQRKVYNDTTLKEYILKRKPIEVIEQENNNLAILYNFEETKKILKVVIRPTDKIYIVTFYILNRGQTMGVGK
jgi:hypothetical protein